MKVTVISNLFPPHVIGGYELGCLSLVRAARTAGHDVRVLSSACVGRLKKRPQPLDLDVRYIFNPIYHYESAISGVPASDYIAAFGGIDTANVLALKSQLEEFKPDAVWIFNPLGLGPIGIVETAIASGCPTTLHLMDHLDQTIADHQACMNLAGRWARAKSRMGAIACSRKTLQRNELIGRFRDKMVIANGVRLGARTKTVPSEIGPCLKLVYFGQVERHKGLLQLVEAVARLKNRLSNQEVELHIIGSGSRLFSEELGLKIDQLNIGKYVIQHGFMNPDVLKAKLSEMHLAVFPLNPDEPFAYVVIEAIDAGLPIIVTREAGCAEFLPADYPYLLNDRDDVSELENLLVESVKNRSDMLKWIDPLKDCVYDQCDLERQCLPRCIEFISQRYSNVALGETFDRSVDNLLASWQSSRQMNSFVTGGSSIKTSTGKRLERWVRRNVSTSFRRTVKLKFRQLMGKAA